MAFKAALEMKELKEDLDCLVREPRESALICASVLGTR